MLWGCIKWAQIKATLKETVLLATRVLHVGVLICKSTPTALSHG